MSVSHTECVTHCVCAERVYEESVCEDSMCQDMTPVRSNSCDTDTYSSVCEE